MSLLNNETPAAALPALCMRHPKVVLGKAETASAAACCSSSDGPIRSKGNTLMPLGACFPMHLPFTLCTQ